MTPGIRWVWGIAGLAFTAIGSAGVFLPLLPATPFLLIAAGCFTRSSPRLHVWLLNHRWFGPLILNWQREGALSRRTKATALVTIVATPLLSLVLGAPRWAIGIQILILIVVSTWIWTRPEPDQTNFR